MQLYWKPALRFPERVGRGAFGFERVDFLWRIRNGDVVAAPPTPASRLSPGKGKDGVELGGEAFARGEVEVYCRGVREGRQEEGERQRTRTHSRVHLWSELTSKMGKVHENKRNLGTFLPLRERQALPDSRWLAAVHSDPPWI